MRISRQDFPDFSKTQYRLSEVFQNLPTWAGNAALNFYKDSWRRKGYINSRFERWPKRKSGDDSRQILIGRGSGHLRRSLRLRVNRYSFVVWTDREYAEIHNEGGTIVQTVTKQQRKFFWRRYYEAVKIGHKSQAEMWRRMALSETLTIEIPKRQFMDKPDGPISPFLERRIQMHVERALATALRG